MKRYILVTVLVLVSASSLAQSKQTSVRSNELVNLNRLHAHVVPNCSRAVMAHHGWADFDRTKQVEVSGIIIESKYENPHAFVRVRSDQGYWAIELSAVPRMRRHNITSEMIKTGTRVTLVGHPHKKRAREMKAIKMVLNGKTFDLTS